jgi:transcription elongation factor Elf1
MAERRRTTVPNLSDWLAQQVTCCFCGNEVIEEKGPILLVDEKHEPLAICGRCRRHCLMNFLQNYQAQVEMLKAMWNAPSSGEGWGGC